METDTSTARTLSARSHYSELNILVIEQSWLHLLAELIDLEGGAALERFASLLDEGALGLVSSSAQWQRALNVSVERFRLYRDVLKKAPSEQALIIAARAAAITVARVSEGCEAAEVAWTFPDAELPGVRTTGGVSRDVVRGSVGTLLIVGYSVTTDPMFTGLASQTIGAIADASARGVSVTVVLHRDANRNALLRAFRDGIPKPRVFTWPERQDPISAVHAKVIVADRQDALVTSAHLT